MIFTGI